jgi:outer membrane protein assembly factor BamB
MRTARLAWILLLTSCSLQGRPLPSSPASPPPLSTTSAAPVTGWPTYHHDPARTGRGPSTPAISSLHEVWKSVTVDGDVYAEPLIVGDQVLVATEGDSVYAFDAASGELRWRTHLGEPVPRRVLPCGNIDPTGITSTPVADPAGGTVFVLAFLQPGRHELFALDLRDGSIRFHRGFDPPGADPLAQQQRSALALSRGRVQVAYGGRFGDCGRYHGWLVAVAEDGSGGLLTYRVASGTRGGIWAPPGPSVDSGGDIFVTTGNAEGDGFNYGNAVIRLSPELKVLDWFAPSDWAELNRDDADLGSTGPALLEDGLIFQIGKTGAGYLLRAGHLGGIGGQLFKADVCAAAYGGTAYAPPFIYVPCTDGLVAVRLGSGPAFQVAWRGPDFQAGPPIIAGGTLWTVDVNAGELYGLDPNTGQVRLRHRLGSVTHFASLSAANGKLYITAGRALLALGP